MRYIKVQIGHQVIDFVDHPNSIMFSYNTVNG